MGAFSRSLVLGASDSGSYGSESARFQAPLSFLVVQTTPVADTTHSGIVASQERFVY